MTFRRILGRILSGVMMLMTFAFVSPAHADAPIDRVLMDGVAVEADLDGDGAQEKVLWHGSSVEVSDAEGNTGAWSLPFEVSGARAIDLNGTGQVQILIWGDMASDDYYIVCLEWQSGGLHAVLFPDIDRGENTNGWYELGYGYLESAGDGKIALVGSQDVLGTYFMRRTLRLTPWQRFEIADDGFWVYDAPDDWHALTLIAPVQMTAVTDDGEETVTLPTGATMNVIASDKKHTVWVKTPDGKIGYLNISQNAEAGWGWLVEGMPETEIFEYVPYAD